MQDEYQDILDFWFGPISGEVCEENRQKLWFMGGVEIDEEIKQRFGDRVVMASEGALEHWLETPEGNLAYVILLDQFTRNIYRKQARAFASDHLARKACRAGLAKGFDQQLAPIQRVFFYLPLEHSEDLADQQECCDLYAALRDCVSEQNEPVFAGFYDYAVKHHDIIAQFGCFPHRNDVLGREGTEEQNRWLEESGVRFGQ